jgi:hypothetical protein
MVGGGKRFTVSSFPATTLYLVVASNFKSYCTPCFACVGNVFVPFVLRVQTAAQGLSGIAVFNLD